MHLNGEELRPLAGTTTPTIVAFNNQPGFNQNVAILNRPITTNPQMEFRKRLKLLYPAGFVASISFLFFITNLSMFILLEKYDIQIKRYNTINSLFVSKYVELVSLTNMIYALLAFLTSKHFTSHFYIQKSLEF
jgi:hypothetical protein